MSDAKQAMRDAFAAYRRAVLEEHAARVAYDGTREWKRASGPEWHRAVVEAIGHKGEAREHLEQLIIEGGETT